MKGGRGRGSRGVTRITARGVNITQVARAAGVGTGTVSRVLNDSASVRPATRARVQEVIERLDYRPSRLASGLSRGSPRTVAIVVPFMTRPSVVERLAGAIAVLDENGYDTVVLNVETAEQRDRHLESLTARHRAAGVVIVSMPPPARFLGAFALAGIPLVLVDTEAAGVARTIADDAKGGRLATEHLIALGHRRIGFVGDLGYEGIGNSSTRLRFAGYRAALDAAGIAFDAALVRQGPHGAATSLAHAEELLGLDEPPTAIFAISDTQAMGVLAAADRLGVDVPGELSVVGYDDIEAATLLGLTTVRQPLKQSGAHGAERLCLLLRGERVRPLRQELPVEVVTRTSSGAPGGRAQAASAPRAARPGRAVRDEVASDEHGKEALGAASAVARQRAGVRGRRVAARERGLGHSPSRRARQSRS